MKASYNKQTKIIDTLWPDESIVPKDVDIIDFPEEYLQKFYANDYFYFTYENQNIEEHINSKRQIEDQIFVLKQNLLNTDYVAIKFAEGELNAKQFEPTKNLRKEWRQTINDLEAILVEQKEED